MSIEKCRLEAEVPGEIQKLRKLGSEDSLGLSDSTIYDLAVSIIKDRKLCGSILDFGAGRGLLVEQLYNAGLFSKVTGVDLMERPKELHSAIDWQAQDLNFQTPFRDSSFDVVVSTETIQCMENPRATVREWRRLLKPGGTLIVSMPNNESLRAISYLFVRGHFLAYSELCKSFHISVLFREDFRRIYSELLFSPPEFIFSNRGFIPKLTRRTWQQVSFGLLRGLRFSDNFFVVSKKLG